MFKIYRNITKGFSQAISMSEIKSSHYFLNKMLMANSIQRIFKRTVIIKKLKHGDKSVTVHLRHMVDEDIPQLTEMRKRNKFYDPISVYAMCTKIDPTSFIIADNGEGRVMGFLVAFKNIENIVVGGMRTVHEDYRNMGLSSKLLYPRGLEVVGDRTVIAVSLMEEIFFNKKRNPYLTKNFTIIDFESKSKIFPERLSSHIPEGVKIQKFEDSHLTTVLEYDHLSSGFRRESLIEYNCHDPYGETVTALRDGKCVGYGTIKLDIQGGKKVGPLYADNPEIAEAILKHLLECFKSVEGFHGNALSNNAPALLMFEKLGEMRIFINYRLSTKEIDCPEYKNVYSVFDCEIQPV